MSDATCAVLMPTLERPANLKRVLQDLKVTRGQTPYEIYCMVAETDIDSQRVCADFDVRYWIDERGWFAERTQALFELTDEPWVFTGTDDIRFSSGWLDRLFKSAPPSAKVIAPYDGHNPHPTNFLVNRAYVMEHGGHWGCPGKVFHPAYTHMFVDNEMVGVAVARDVFFYATDVLVEATHPHWGNAPQDDTYTRSQRRYEKDEKVYNRRKHLWAS